MKRFMVTYTTRTSERDEEDAMWIDISDANAAMMWNPNGGIIAQIQSLIEIAARLKGKNGLTARIKEIGQEVEE